jgi:hypothetical protein
MIESPYNMNKLKQFLNNNLKKYWTVEITDFCWMMDVGGSRLEDSENLFCKFSVVGWLLFVVGKIKGKIFKKQKTKLPKYQYTVFLGWYLFYFLTWQREI